MSNSEVKVTLSKEILNTIKPGNRFRLKKSKMIDRDAWFLVTSVLSSSSAVSKGVGAIPMPNSRYHQTLNNLGSQIIELFSVDQIAELESVWEVDVEAKEIKFLPLGQAYGVSAGNIYEIDEDGGKVSRPYDSREGVSAISRAYNLYKLIMAHQVKGTLK